MLGSILFQFSRKVAGVVAVLFGGYPIGPSELRVLLGGSEVHQSN